MADSITGNFKISPSNVSAYANGLNPWSAFNHLFAKAAQVGQSGTVANVVFSMVEGEEQEDQHAQHLTALEEYLEDKENTGAVSGVRVLVKPRAMTVFDTTMGFMRKVVEPWLREYATTWRLCVWVSVEESDRGLGPFNRKEQIKMPPDQQVMVVLKVKAHYRKGTLRFLEGVKKKHGRCDAPGRTKAAERASRLAQRHASRHRARIVRRRCSRSR